MFKSESIKSGIQKSFESGTSKIADKSCYGYSKAPDGNLTINEKEAQIVRFIFARYLIGDSLGKIVDTLAEKKAPSPSGKDRWSRKVVDGLLSNEKYVGQVLLQKTYHPIWSTDQKYYRCPVSAARPSPGYHFQKVV